MASVLFSLELPMELSQYAEMRLNSMSMSPFSKVAYFVFVNRFSCAKALEGDAFNKERALVQGPSKVSPKSIWL